MKIVILDGYTENPGDLSWEALAELGEKPFRAAQVFSWLHKGARFEDMTNLSLSLREKLRANGIDQPVTIRETRVSRLDGTKKYLFALPDGNCIEGVLMRLADGLGRKDGSHA